MINTDEYKGLQGAGIATTAHILADKKSFFKKRFRDDTDEDTMEVFWDKGLTRVAKALSVFRQSNNPMRAALGEIYEMVNRTLASIESHGPKDTVEEVFNRPLNAGEVAVIKSEHPNLQNGCTSDKKLLKWIFEDACGAEMCRWKQKASHWKVNEGDNIKNIGELFPRNKVHAHEEAVQLPPYAFIGPV